MGRKREARKAARRKLFKERRVEREKRQEETLSDFERVVNEHATRVAGPLSKLFAANTLPQSMYERE